MISDLRVQELKALLDQEADFQLLDVREIEEREICTITPDVHIPLSDLADELEKLDQNKKTIVYCRSGQRSLYASELLQNHGFKEVFNLRGGILAWAREIDPNCPTY